MDLNKGIALLQIHGFALVCYILLGKFGFYTVKAMEITMIRGITNEEKPTI